MPFFYSFQRRERSLNFVAQIFQSAGGETFLSRLGMTGGTPFFTKKSLRNRFDTVRTGAGGRCSLFHRLDATSVPHDQEVYERIICCRRGSCFQSIGTSLRLEQGEA